MPPGERALAWTWAQHQAWEAAWWGDCRDTAGEERKHRVYATRMGLTWPPDLGGRSVVDLGGGPVSMLLRAHHVTYPIVVDPCPFPAWVLERYRAAGIRFFQLPAEEYPLGGPVLDEAWVYNALQHVRDPETVCAVARASARLVRVFEWVEVPRDRGHPHTLHAEDLDAWLHGRGAVTALNEDGCVGLAYAGTFPTGAT